MANRSRMAETLDRLECWLRDHHPAFLAAMRPGATDAELDDLERVIANPLPSDVRAFYKWRNGVSVADNADEDGWYAGPDIPFWGRPMPLAEVRSEYELCCELGVSTWNDPAQPSWWHNAWVPLFDVNFGPLLLCVDTVGVWTGVRGQIVRFDNKMPTRAITAGSLGDWLRVLVREFECRRPFGCGVDSDNNAHFFYPAGYPVYREVTDPPSVPEPEPITPKLEPVAPDPGSFCIGDRVRVREGAFVDYEGVIKELEAGTWQVTVTFEIWDREFNFPLRATDLAVVERSTREPPVGRWQGATDAQELFALLEFTPSVRKLRLFVAACYREKLTAWSEAVEPLCHAIEDLAEDDAAIAALGDAVEGLWNAARSHTSNRQTLESLASFCLPPLGDGKPIESAAPRMVYHATPDLVREIFPNPFVPPRFDPAWRNGTAVSLAHQMHESRDFSVMPILADALQDAGCDNDDILAHCRNPGRHVRGCWVVDLVLEK